MGRIWGKIKEGLVFIRRNPSILFSFVLLVLIPLALFIQTTFVVRTFERNIDFILQEKALALGRMVGAIADDYVEDKEELQRRIFLLAEENPDFHALRLIAKDVNGEFTVIASKDPSQIGERIVDDTSLLLASGKNQAFAYESKDSFGRFWNVVIPFGGAAHYGLITLSLSLASSDAIILQSIRWSYVLLFGFILLVLFLVVQHTRLFQYVFISTKLQEIDEMKDQFIRMAIHELQAPMVNVRSYLYVLRDEIRKVVAEERAPELYRDIFRGILSAERLILLIQDMLQVSRIERGILDLTPSKVQPEDLLQQLVEEFKNKAEAKGLALEYRPKIGEYLLYINANRLGEVIGNLIDNAIKYTRSGKIAVNTSLDESRRLYFINVEDSGIGISAEEQVKLFSKFYRVRNKETQDISGTGLGLWIAKTLTEAMRGKILVESVRGSGSRFSVAFPYVAR